MVSHTGRLYSLALALVVFFLAWAVVAAHPWGRTASDPRLKALTVREAQLRHEARLVNQVVALRWAAYRNASEGPHRPDRGREGTGRATARLRLVRLLVRVGARRDAAAAHGDEDVVMERRTFHAMGTEMELLVDADDAVAAIDAAEAEFHRLEALLSRFRDDSELSRLNRDGSIEAGPDLLRVVELALAAREQDRRPLRPDRPRRRRRGRIRPVLRRHRSGEHTSDAGPAAVAGGGVSVDGVRIVLDPGVRIDLGGIGKGYAAERAAELLGPRRPVSRQRRRRHRHPRRLLAGRRRDCRRRADARARRCRARHLGPRPAPLAARRPRAAPPDRPAHRRAGGDRPPPGHRRRAGRGRGRGRREVALPRRRRRARAPRRTRPASPPCSSPRRGRCSPEGSA